MTQLDRINLDVSDGIARLRLNRPDKLNALDAAMIEALRAACHDIERSAAAVVILSGAGKAFSAGGDIAAWSRETPHAFGQAWVRDGHAAFDALARLRQPLIAVLDGHTLGGGLELAAVADYRIAERQVTVGQPETGLGIIPGWSGTQRAVRRFGAQIVRRMALFGEVLSADDAEKHGIIDCVVEIGMATEKAEEVAAAVLARAPRATELTKMLINAAEREETERILEALAGTIAAGTDELQEGLAAFREKRPPDYRKADP